MRTNKIIPVDYYHRFPYTYMHLEKRERDMSKPTKVMIREGSMPKIQNCKSRIITFYKSISRF